VNALSLGNLTVTYSGRGGDHVAVRDVDLHVGDGEIVGVIGESGSGKSTIALAAQGLLPDTARVQARELSVAGHDVAGFSEDDWCRIRGKDTAMVFQEPMSALNPCQRIGRQIAEVLRLHGLADRRTARARALEALRQVRMPDPERRLDHYPHQLSGGQRQRVVIAIALIANPSLIVADEPTTALDVTVQAGILDLLRSARDTTGAGVLFISHDLGVVSRVCDRVSVMYRGRVVESGAAQRLLRDPQHPYTRALLGSSPGPGVAPRAPLAVIDPSQHLEQIPAVVS